jgi:exodeoxyribonuclease V alpha subunit
VSLIVFRSGTLAEWQTRGGSGWGFGSLRMSGGDRLKVVGTISAREGDYVELCGMLDEHPRFGTQLKVSSCEVQLPREQRAVCDWLQAKLPGVGPTLAERLWERFNDRLWVLLDEGDVGPLMALRGITEKRAYEMVDAYRKHAGNREAERQLLEYGLTTSAIATVSEVYDGPRAALMAIEGNPYCLQQAVRGWGFKRADALARRMGIVGDDQRRIHGATWHVMGEATSRGHCFVPVEKLRSLVARVCELSGEEVPEHRWDRPAPGILFDEQGRAWKRFVEEDEQRAAALLGDRL